MSEIDKYSSTWRVVAQWALVGLVDARTELENELTSETRSQFLRGRIAALAELALLPEPKRTEVLSSDADYH